MKLRAKIGDIHSILIYFVDLHVIFTLNMRIDNSPPPLFGPMEFPIKFDTDISGWSIVYIEVLQDILPKMYYIFFSED